MAVGVSQALSWLLPRMWRTDHHDETPRVAGNARLTALTGVALLILMPVPYVSAPFLDQMWKVHFFGGLILLPLLGVKVGSTGLRFARYYLGSRDFREAGPPALIPRVTGPPLVLSTALLMGSGIQMALDGNRFSAWSTVHNASAVVFSAALAVHLVAHVQNAPRRVLADLRRSGRLNPARGPALRVALVVAALVAGVGVAAGGLAVSHWTARPHRLHDVAHVR